MGRRRAIQNSIKQHEDEVNSLYQRAQVHMGAVLQAVHDSDQEKIVVESDLAAAIIVKIEELVQRGPPVVPKSPRKSRKSKIYQASQTEESSDEDQIKSEFRYKEYTFKLAREESERHITPSMLGDSDKSHDSYKSNDSGYLVESGSGSEPDDFASDSSIKLSESRSSFLESSNSSNGAKTTIDETDEGIPIAGPKRGYLKRKGGLLGKQSRYFVVVPEKDALNWYSTEKDAKSGNEPKGRIVLHNAEVSTTLEKEKEKTEVKNIFYLRLPGGKILGMQAANQNDRDEWVRAIQEVIQLKK
eukprot:TRINITY_DN3614_c0_g1_i1.p1 TRINITY_DN3614_c0_g1~~TRINITY_DN3614_c0_g1_i1.p1  ORF type:complete len:301 (+),score=47.18 TRINITY_DN3614_c0_g1_i1:125-1027(+)